MAACRIYGYSRIFEPIRDPARERLAELAAEVAALCANADDALEWFNEHLTEKLELWRERRCRVSARVLSMNRLDMPVKE